MHAPKHDHQELYQARNALNQIIWILELSTANEQETQAKTVLIKNRLCHASDCLRRYQQSLVPFAASIASLAGLLCEATDWMAFP